MRPIHTLFLGSFCTAFAPILVKAMAINPTMIGVYRTGFGAVLLWMLARMQPVRATRETIVPRRRWLVIVGAGIFFALNLYLWHRAIILSGAGIATIIENTQVIYVALIGLLFFKERLHWRLLVAMPLALGGIVLLVNPAFPTSNLAQYWLGIGYALSTAVAYAGFLVMLRMAGEGDAGRRAMMSLAMICAVTCIVLFIAAIGEGDVAMPHGIDWLWTALLVVIVQICGWYWITSSLPHIPISRGGLVLLTQPTFATIFGAVFFREYLGVWQIAGALLTLGAIYLGAIGKARRQEDEIGQRGVMHE